MTERWMRLSHVVVRMVATITLADLGIVVVSERYYPAFSHALANSRLGAIQTFWTMYTSLLLPPYVGFEIWWMQKREPGFKALLIDAVLAIACFLFYIGVVLYAFGHYAMF